MTGSNETHRGSKLNMDMTHHHDISSLLASEDDRLAGSVGSSLAEHENGAPGHNNEIFRTQRAYDTCKQLL